MTPEEIMEAINHLLAKANTRQLELIRRIIQAIIK